MKSIIILRLNYYMVPFIEQNQLLHSFSTKSWLLVGELIMILIFDCSQNQLGNNKFQ